MFINRFLYNLRRRCSLYLTNVFRLQVVRLSPKQQRFASRFAYQQEYLNFGVTSTEQILDIGSGADPFPYATVLVDRFPERSHHRYTALKTNDKPFLVADMCSLPFPSKHFDFVYCSHVLEHVEDPVQACSELIRVAKRGYIETPTLAKDSLYAWAKGMHKWHVVSIGTILCFFEYSPRQLEGIRSSVWRELINGHWHHPLQDVVEQNLDIFNVMFLWKEKFSVMVFRQDGTVTTTKLTFNQIKDTL